MSVSLGCCLLGESDKARMEHAGSSGDWRVANQELRT